MVEEKICLFLHFSNFGKSSCFWVNIKRCDQIKGDNLQDLASTESPKDIVLNITDPSDKPGSILTTLIDGFLLPKQPSQPDIDTGNDEKDNSVASLSDVDSESVKETVGGFPVTNILSGIYNLVSSYIQPSDEELEQEEPITAIPQNAINVHNIPRDQLIHAYP